MTDDLVSGTQHNGRMSPVRRFYLLLCTFDILFILLLWIISILVTGKDLYTELQHQIEHYSIKVSGKNGRNFLREHVLVFLRIQTM